jgi:hypothetical protein
MEMKCFTGDPAPAGQNILIPACNYPRAQRLVPENISRPRVARTEHTHWHSRLYRLCRCNWQASVRHCGC